jgi:uncharacterized LabA/DUF88 family protein
LGVRSQGWNLDFEKFFIYLQDKFKIKKAFLFIGYIKENERMYRALRAYGYSIIFKPAVKFNKKSIKGNVDAELVLHSAKIQYKKYKKAVIVTGDGDFYCLMEDMVKERRLRALIIPNRKFQSNLLKSFEGYKFFLDKEKSKLEKR